MWILDLAELCLLLIFGVIAIPQIRASVRSGQMQAFQYCHDNIRDEQRCEYRRIWYRLIHAQLHEKNIKLSERNLKEYFEICKELHEHYVVRLFNEPVDQLEEEEKQLRLGIEELCGIFALLGSTSRSKFLDKSIVIDNWRNMIWRLGPLCYIHTIYRRNRDEAPLYWDEIEWLYSQIALSKGISLAEVEALTDVLGGNHDTLLETYKKCRKISGMRHFLQELVGYSPYYTEKRQISIVRRWKSR